MPASRRLTLLLALLAGTSAAAAFLLSAPDPGLVGERFGVASSAQVESAYLEIRDCLAREGSGVASSCYDRVAREQTARTNPATVVEAVRLGLERDTLLFEATCHNFMHVVGQVSAVYVRSFEELRAAAAQMTDVCQFGMYHGLVEGYADLLPDRRLREEFPLLCTAMQDVELVGRATREYVNGECYHGIGHVAARRTEDRFLEGLEMCALVPEGSDATSCATGVIMNWTDNVVRWSRRVSSGEVGEAEMPAQYRVVPLSSRWEVCELVGDLFRPPCLLWMGSAAVDPSSPAEIRSDLSEYLGWCARFTDEPSRSSCARSVGMMAGDLTTMTVLGGPEVSASLCGDLVADELLLECVGHAAAVALSFLPPDQVMLLCEPWAGSPRYGEVCREVEGRLSASLSVRSS